MASIPNIYGNATVMTEKNTGELLQVSIADLVPYASNARTHSEEQVLQIAASIREFGFTNPVLIDGESNIIAGHGRVARLMELEPTYVDVIVRRWQEFTGKRATLEASGQTFAELATDRLAADHAAA